MSIDKSKRRIGFCRAWMVCFILSSTICYQAMSQNEVYFDHITTEEGLSQNDVNCIYQDQLGFMWFGTHDGLNKYDGYGFTIFKPDANKPGSISSNLIYSMVGDKDGNLWIGTTGSGIDRFDRNTEQFTNYKFQAGDDGSLNSDHVIVVYVDSQNRLWVGTTEGLNLMDLNNYADGAQFTRFSSGDLFGIGPDGNNIFSIYEDSRKKLWIGTHGGLYQLILNEHGEAGFHLVGKDKGLGQFPVRDILEDKQGRLVVATEKGLYYQENQHTVAGFMKISEGQYFKIKLDAQGNIWSGNDEGLSKFAGYGPEKMPHLVARHSIDLSNPRSLNKNVIRCLYRDQMGIMWIGTNGGGVNKFDPQRKQFRHFRNTLNPGSLSYNKIRAIYEDSNGTIWIGTEGGGLNMQSSADDSDSYNNFKNFQVITKSFAIAEINQGNKKTLLFGSETTPTLFKLDISNPNNIKEENILPVQGVSNSVFTILQDHRRNVWIGTYKGGVYRWTPQPGEEDYKIAHFQNDPGNLRSVSSDIIRNIYEASDGSIWFGTGDGLNKLAPEEVGKEDPGFTIYKNIPGDARSISHNYILALHESSAGDLWIGTFGGGLNKFVPGRGENAGSFISYSESEGLPNNVIKGILEDDEGYLWLSTNKGLSRFDPVREHFKNYDVNDGLQSNEFQELACYKRKNGEMLFGGINGFNAFYPMNITDNSFEAETVIANFLILNKPVKIGTQINGRVLLENPVSNTSEIRLKYKENSFSFEFSALHFAAPGKNKFAYKLEGFNQDWIYTSADNRFATYTNLSPGDYTFKVKASNNDGLWDPSPASIDIIVIPPWWRTKLAYVIYGLLILALLIAFRKYTIIRTTEKHQLMLEHMEKEKTDEMQRMKLEFFTNISHEIRTPLTLIKGPLEYLLKNEANLGGKERQQQYTLMQKNSNYLIRLVNQLLDFRKIDQGKMKLYLCQADIVNFIQETTGPFLFLANKKNIRYTIDAPSNPVEAWFDPDAMEKIVNNLLSNAFKFTLENGAITVSIKKTRFPEEGGHHSGATGKSDWVTIEVSDTGCGIPPEKMDHIFDRFYVDKEKYERNKQGIGIGLSFTKSLVELHNGSIQVESEINDGTTFKISFPLGKDFYEEGETIQYHSQFPHGRLSVDTGLETVEEENMVDNELLQSDSNLPVLLIIDDNADIRTFIKQGLADKYQIYQAEDGAQGLKVMKTVVPNIIICDIMMPVMDGIEFCTNIKSNEQTSHIPIILLTAKTNAESEVEGLKTGADDYLKKPFDMEVLELKIKKIINYREDLRKRFRLELTMEPSEVTVTSADEKFLGQAMGVIEDHMMDTEFNVETMVKELGLSRSNLYLKLKELTGLSSSEFIRNIRLKRAVQLLKQGDLSVKEVMYRTGFNTASYFSKCFKKQFGMVPSDYIRQTQNVEEVR
ncbi:two-component regulator propeller domain-containing protein [Fulvivirgaceae bacterium BMA12]|uniref:histidine kinase n=1 Tax=Agaribacillus aureus TaxID=3051825 RepID=A0ABT8L276_9BACT|nr:two-component regulator propeller domain-containing protein [Fulvivirgaceae bacterium BMA12]